MGWFTGLYPDRCQATRSLKLSFFTVSLDSFTQLRTYGIRYTLGRKSMFIYTYIYTLAFSCQLTLLLAPSGPIEN